jgi:hypothetical protein
VHACHHELQAGIFIFQRLQAFDFRALPAALLLSLPIDGLWKKKKKKKKKKKHH